MNYFLYKRKPDASSVHIRNSKGQHWCARYHKRWAVRQMPSDIPPEYFRVNADQAKIKNQRITRDFLARRHRDHVNWYGHKTQEIRLLSSEKAQRTTPCDALMRELTGYPSATDYVFSQALQADEHSVYEWRCLIGPGLGGDFVPENIVAMPVREASLQLGAEAVLSQYISEKLFGVRIEAALDAADSHLASTLFVQVLERQNGCVVYDYYVDLQAQATDFNRVDLADALNRALVRLGPSSLYENDQDMIIQRIVLAKMQAEGILAPVLRGRGL